MNRPDQPLDLDAIEARANAATEGPWEVDPLNYSIISAYNWVAEANETSAKFISAARTDVPALIAEVKRLREEVADQEALRIAARASRRWSRTLDLLAQAEQPDPLDENDHRDRVGAATGIRIRWNGWHWCEREDCDAAIELAYANGTLANWNSSRHGPITFADDPQAPQNAQSQPVAALEHAALTEVAEAAHRLSQAICDLLDLAPQEDQ